MTESMLLQCVCAARVCSYAALLAACACAVFVVSAAVDSARVLQSVTPGHALPWAPAAAVFVGRHAIPAALVVAVFLAATLRLTLARCGLIFLYVNILSALGIFLAAFVFRVFSEQCIQELNLLYGTFQ